MDPNAAFAEMTAALDAGNLSEAKERAEAIREWTERGGFPPSAPNWRMAVDDVIRNITY